MPNYNQIGYLNNSKKLSNLPIYSTVNQDNNAKYTKRYYSSTEAEIYFSNIDNEPLPNEGYVDEIVQIQFTVQQNVLPLFGYNSYVYDEVAIGNRIIQGAFTINFTSPNYLFTLLDSFNDNINKNKKPLYDMVFSIDIGYGGSTSIQNEDKLTTIEPQRSTLEGVTILSCSQQLDIEGNPILEQYTFVARDYVPNIAQINNTTVKKQKNKNVIKNNINLDDAIKNIFLWQNANKEWLLLAEINQYYKNDIKSINVVLQDGFKPRNVKKTLMRQKDGRWGSKVIEIAENKKYKIDLTAIFNDTSKQTKSTEIFIKKKI